MSEPATLQTVLRLVERLATEMDGLKSAVSECKASFRQMEFRFHDLENSVDRLDAADGAAADTDARGTRERKRSD
jgi:hypothetical protein